VIRTLHSEWTKLRTQRGTLVALFMTGLLMTAFSAFFAAEQETNAVIAGDDDLVQMGLMGIAFAEIAVVVVGASLITAEFGSGMIRTTLTATQGRLRVLLAKAIVLSVVVFPVALATSAAGFVIAQSLLRDNGYQPPAYPEVSLTDPGAARAVIGTALLLTAYALIALGLGTVLRHSGATIATGFALLFLPLLFLGAFPEGFARRIEQFTPLAGMAIQSTTDRMLAAFDGRSGMPIGPWQGLGVAFAWALGALALGFLVLRYRDL
jgi:ABC-type transport system involved in multi-copper enzyme maturation permease subunit